MKIYKLQLQGQESISLYSDDFNDLKHEIIEDINESSYVIHIEHMSEEKWTELKSSLVEFDGF